MENVKENHSVEVRKNLNQENFNMIINYFISNNVPTEIGFDIDKTDINNIQPQVQVNVKVDGIPDFAFFSNTKTDEKLYYSIVIELENGILDKEFEMWKKEFVADEVFIDIIRDDVIESVDFYGEISHGEVTLDKIKNIHKYLLKRTPLMNKILEKSCKR